MYQVTQTLQQLNLHTQILNMPAQSTQSPSVNQGGYASDVSEGQNRRTSRVTTPVKRPGMIQPSSDSRRSIGQPISIVTNNPTKKQKNVPSESDTETQITPIANKKKGKKAAKNPPLVLNQPWTPAHPRLSISLKTLMMKMRKSNINVNGGMQSLMTSRFSFLNHIVARVM